ncbi:hypothetical protein [Pedobacter mucosus]|uniref:hypothetical protein n=1 Tax=Pedobacter mucosus TaxID=2895286 RepID=UPI001EE4D130|nr:hypothetical protein [Pedobacter mucosus]UKT66008.1 hypothetical protein LOK61_09495 [Pedobacter mucosus]
MCKTSKRFISLLLVSSSLFFTDAKAQQTVFSKENLTPHLTEMSIQEQNGKRVVRVVKSAQVIKVDEPTYVKINNIKFQNGTIELKVMGKLLADAPDSARAFIGLAFRINADDSRFEGIYLRPTNAVSTNQLRRNRSVQYFSYPDFKFYQSRKTNPGEFETYADIAPDQWIKLRIVIKGANAKLFINDSKNPSMIVNDMKMGADQIGALGLWVDIGTEGYFSDLVVTKDK